MVTENLFQEPILQQHPWLDFELKLVPIVKVFRQPLDLSSEPAPEPITFLGVNYVILFELAIKFLGKVPRKVK